MIVDIKKYFKEKKVVSLYNLSIHFKVEDSAMEQMLELLVKKHFIRVVDQDCSSGSCEGCFVSNCEPSKAKFFEIWEE